MDAIPHGEAIDIAAGLIITVPGIFGAYAHWWTVKRQGRIGGSFIDYMLADNPAHTGITVVTFLTAMGGMNWLGLFDQVSTEYTIEALKNWQIYKPTALAVIASIVTGYTCDSGLNKSDQK